MQCDSRGRFETVCLFIEWMWNQWLYRVRITIDCVGTEKTSSWVPTAWCWSLFYNFSSICSHATRVFIQYFKIVLKQLSIPETRHSMGFCYTLTLWGGRGEGEGLQPANCGKTQGTMTTVVCQACSSKCQNIYSSRIFRRISFKKKRILVTKFTVFV